jgi:hypothetical protein
VSIIREYCNGLGEKGSVGVMMCICENVSRRVREEAWLLLMKEGFLGNYCRLVRTRGQVRS